MIINRPMHGGGIARPRPFCNNLGNPSRRRVGMGSALTLIPVVRILPARVIVAGQFEKGLRWHKTVYGHCRDCHR
jgi:hypothetical protein